MKEEKPNVKLIKNVGMLYWKYIRSYEIRKYESVFDVIFIVYYFSGTKGSQDLIVPNYHAWTNKNCNKLQ